MKMCITVVSAATAFAAISLFAKEFPLEWNADFPTDVPYEFEVLPARLGAENLTIKADGRAIAATAFDGREVGSLAWRFTVPAGTKALTCETTGGTAARADSAAIDNIFAGALDPANAKGWKSDAQPIKVVPVDGAMRISCPQGSPNARYEAAVPEALRGQSVKFEFDIESKTPMTWGCKSFVEQYDAAGKRLVQTVCDPRWTSHMRPQGVKATYREWGHIDRRAAKVALVIELRNQGRAIDEYGMPTTDATRTVPDVVVSRLALRGAAELPFPKYADRNFAAGVTGAAADKALVLGGERAFWYQCHPMAVWAGAGVVRSEDELFFPNDAGTAEAWFRPTAWPAPSKTYVLFDAINGYHAEERLRDSGGEMVCLAYVPAKKELTLEIRDHYKHEWKVSAAAEIPVGVWSHLAVAWEPNGTAEVYLNGRKAASMKLDGYVVCDMTDLKKRFVNDWQPMEFYIGARYASARLNANKSAESPFFEGTVDEWRVSTGKRYTTDFTPAKVFAIDAATRAHFSFNRTFDGRSGGGTEYIRGSFRDLTDRVDHKLRFTDGTSVQYRPAEIEAKVDPRKVLNIINYPELPTPEEFTAAKQVRTATFMGVNGATFTVDCTSKPYTDFVEIENVSDRAVRYPLVFNEGDLDPRSFGDLRDTLLRTKLSDQDRADRIFNFVIKASDYFMDRQISFKPGLDDPGLAMGSAMLMLNSYCGFECGPLNNMTANMFACSGGLLASQTSGYGHSFEQVFYNGKNHIYDLSAQSFFTAMDNESSAYLEEAGDQPGLFCRLAKSPDHFIRFGHRGFSAQTPDYNDKVGVVLAPGERFRVWFGNDGRQNLLRCIPGSGGGPVRSDRKNLAWKEEFTDRCGGKPRKGNEIYRILRKFPDFANGYLELDVKPTAANPAFSDVTAGSFTYRVKSGYQIVCGAYEATLASGGKAPVEVSTDFGKTWRAHDPADEYALMGRLEYLVRVKAPITAVKRFRAKTVLEINARIFPGRLHAGANPLNLKAADDGQLNVRVQWREKTDRVTVKGGAYAGTIPGFERQFFAMNPKTGLTIETEGFSPKTKVICPMGLTGAFRGGKVTLAAKGWKKDGFADVCLRDGKNERWVTLYISERARLVTGAEAVDLKNGAELLAADADRVQPCVMLRQKDAKLTTKFEKLTAGEYMIFGLSRFPSRTPSAHNLGHRVLAFKNPEDGKYVNACGPVSIPMSYYKGEYGADPKGRGNFHWDTPNDSRHTYHVTWMMARYSCPAFDSLDWCLLGARPDGVEFAAVLIIPAGDAEDYLTALSYLAGLNFDAARVK